MLKKPIVIWRIAALVATVLIFGCSARNNRGFVASPASLKHKPINVGCSTQANPEGKCVCMTEDDFDDLLRQYVAACMSATGDAQGCGAR